MLERLLFFATFSSSSFREAMARLDSVTREVLEQSIRLAVGGMNKEKSSQPQISLRTF